MSKNISKKKKRKPVLSLKMPVIWLILFIAAVLPWRLRVHWASLICRINYKKKGKETVAARIDDFFFK